MREKRSDFNTTTIIGASNIFPLILVTSLFFFWGFVHNLDPVLIPHLKKAFRLTDLETAFVDFSVFIAIL